MTERYMHGSLWYKLPLKLIRIRCEWVSTTMFGSQERV